MASENAIPLFVCVTFVQERRNEGIGTETLLVFKAPLHRLDEAA